MAETGKARKVLLWLGTGVSGLVAFCATISVEDAKSNIAGWLQLVGIDRIPAAFQARTTDLLALAYAVPVCLLLLFELFQESKGKKEESTPDVDSAGTGRGIRRTHVIATLIAFEIAITFALIADPGTIFSGAQSASPQSVLQKPAAEASPASQPAPEVDVATLEAKPTARPTDALESQGEETPRPAPRQLPAPVTPPDPVNISGRWRDSFGYDYWYEQNGSTYTYTVYSGNEVFGVGRGNIVGQFMKSAFSSRERAGTCQGQVDANSTSIVGTCQSPDGASAQFRMSR